MTDDTYRVSFTAKCPISEDDYRAIVAVNAGNHRPGEGFERFTALTAHYDDVAFTTIPLSAERAMMIKLRFGGEMRKID